MRRLALCIILMLFAFLSLPIMTGSAQASEPLLTDAFTHLGFDNVAVADVETFTAGSYEITLYAEIADYYDENELSYYRVADPSELTLILNGSEGGSGYVDPPLTKTIQSGFEFGLSIFTPEGYRYFTETDRNPDGQNHSIIYENLDDPLMYLIVFEDMYELGDSDYQDLLLSLKLIAPPPVIPEVPLGTIITAIVMVLALMGYVGLKRFKPRFLPRQRL